nr:hypothetical protein [Tanacetum cinerariifolium]
GLRDSNYDQLFAYLKQHEAHAKETKMILERLSQPTAQPTSYPLTLLSNVSNTQHGLPSSSTSSITPLPPPRANSSSPADDLIENLTSTLGRPNRGQGMNPRGGSAAGYGEAHNRVGNVNQGQARSGQARTMKCYNCNGGPNNTFDDDVDEQPVQDLALNVDNVFQAKDCDAFDSDVDEAPTALLPMKSDHLMIQIFYLRKHDAIDLKNLLIANDNLIAECLSKEVFSVATKSKLNIARFAKMNVANTSVEARCLALEAELATLRDNSHQENQGAKNVTLKTSVSKTKVQPPVLTRTKHAVDVEPIVSRLRNNRDAHLDYLRHLKESVETICDIVEEAKVLAHTPFIRKKQVTATKPFDKQDCNKHKHVVTQTTQKTNVPVPHSTGVKSYPKASGSQPKSDPKTNRISPAKGANKLPIEDMPRTNKSHRRTTNRVDSSSHLKRTFDLGLTTLVLSGVMEIMWLVKASSLGYTIWKD